MQENQILEVFHSFKSNIFSQENSKPDPTPNLKVSYAPKQTKRKLRYLSTK